MNITHRVKILSCKHNWKLIGGSLIKPIDYFECAKCQERESRINSFEFRVYVSPACIDGIIPKGKFYLGV